MNTWPRLSWRSAASASNADLDQVSRLGSRLAGQLCRLRPYNMGTRAPYVNRQHDISLTRVT